MSEPEHDKTIAECTEELEICPNDVYALSLRGWAWSKKKRYDNAIADFDKALCWDPDRVDVLNNRGLAYSGKGEHLLAVADFTEAISRAPRHTDLHHFYFNRGRSRRLTGAYEDAIEDFNIALRLDDQYVKAYRLRGHSWADRGDYLRALADFDNAIRIGPGSADDFHNRGNAWVSLGKFRKAIKDFTRAIRLEPNNTDIAKTYNSRGIAWKRKGRYAKTLADYERALELDSNSAQRHAVLADFLATCPKSRYRDGARALMLISQASELADKCSADYLGCFASAYAAQGDFLSAIEYQEKALDLAMNQEEVEDMLLYIESYKTHVPCLDKPPSWRDWWS
ncbi:tetratricopeptide repeat protein [Rhodopirellula bahusiensis]|uniref:tetratricopeptide repeat protein n=1 Tax=Rhodopirellula bahusiensis TaxID=2014065 RepID=UPI0032677D68